MRLNPKLYYVSDKALNEEDLAEVKWKSYNGTFDIDPDGTYVIYAKATDDVGNGIIVNSEGLVLDEVKPVITGISNGETYHGDVTFEVTDELADVQEMTVDGDSVTLEDGKYTLAADNDEHTIVVTDKAGNQTTYKITVYKYYYVTFIVDGMEYKKIQVDQGEDASMPEIPHKDGYDEIIDTVDVKHGDTITVPEVPVKKGYTGAWDKVLGSITEDTIVTAVYTKVSDGVDGNLNDNVNTPQMGDENHLVVWSMMTLVSFGVLGVIVRKRKLHR